MASPADDAWGTPDDQSPNSGRVFSTKKVLAKEHLALLKLMVPIKEVAVVLWEKCSEEIDAPCSSSDILEWLGLGTDYKQDNASQKAMLAALRSALEEPESEEPSGDGDDGDVLLPRANNAAALSLALKLLQALHRLKAEDEGTILLYRHETSRMQKDLSNALFAAATPKTGQADKSISRTGTTAAERANAMWADALQFMGAQNYMVTVTSQSHLYFSKEATLKYFGDSQQGAGGSLPKFGDLLATGNRFADIPPGHATAVNALLAAINTLYIKECGPMPDWVVPGTFDESNIEITYQDEDGEEVSGKCHFPSSTHIKATGLVRDINMIQSITKREEMCKRVWSDLTQQWAQNATASINAVVIQAILESRTAHEIKTIIGGPNKADPASSSNSSSSTAKVNNKRKASNGTPVETEGGEPKLAKGKWPRGECFYYCKIGTGTGGCDKGDTCTYKHVTTNAGKYPSAVLPKRST